MHPLVAWLRAVAAPRALSVPQARAMVIYELHEWRRSNSAGLTLLPGYVGVRLTVDSVRAQTGAPRPSIRRALGDMVREGLARRVVAGVFEIIIPLHWPSTAPGWSRKGSGAVAYWR